MSHWMHFETFQGHIFKLNFAYKDIKLYSKSIKYFQLLPIFHLLFLENSHIHTEISIIMWEVMAKETSTIFYSITLLQVWLVTS